MVALLKLRGAMTILKKLGRAELRRLEPGDWVAWSKSHWDNNPVQPDFAFWEAQIMAHPVRSAQYVLVLFNGLAYAVQKNRLFKVPPVTAIEHMHSEYDYNS
jgi:hypothetical protein